MAANDDVLIVGKLDSKELEKSINDLIDFVGDKTTIMAGKFDSAMDKMKSAMKDFAITQKVSVDLMKEAWKDMSASFDAMFKAQSEASGGGKGSGKGAFDDGTVGQLKELINLEEQRRDKMYLGTEELRKQNELLDEQRAKLRSETTSDPKKLVQQYSSEIKRANLMMDKSLPDAERKLREMLRIKNELRATPVLDADAMAALDKKILVLIGRIRDMRQNARGNTLKDVLGMDESSVDAVARKMRALKSIKVGNAGEIHQLGSEYQRLSRLQAELLGKSIQLTHSNNYLAQSFGYIRNRIVYAMTLGAVTNFVKEMYEVRGQYELLERSLGILIDDMRRGSEIFNELNAMAIKSPFTLMELATGAKQLLAYNFAEEEVVDTTRRLADISAALGVPMERLVYNLGQIRAQTVLTARDARDFANAGLAIVPMLAKMYTEQKTFGDEMVTTAKVYDMMSKKMVTYSDVLKVLYRVTDEGGKFFDFQAKQADTLRVQMANLTLAYNNMLNEIGAENQGVLSGMVGGLKTLLKNWKEISRAILTLVTTLGTYKAVAAIVSALNSRMFVGSVLVGLRNYILGIKSATGAMATFNAITKANPIAFLISALVAAIGYFALFNHKVKETTVEMERFGENASKQIKKVETLGKVLAGIEEGSSTYKKALSDLNQVVSEYGLTEIKNRDEINSKIQQTIQLIKEEGKERQYANNIAKGEERYINDTGQAKSSLNESLLGLEGWFGTTGKVRKEILDNAEAITDVASSIIEENINLVVNKTGDEAYKGLLEIQNKVRSGLKNSGLSESAIDFILRKGYVNAAIKDYRIATEEHERYNQKIKGYYDAATKATQSTMTFTEKIKANARALRNNTEDALSLYNRIYDIVKIAKENHVINFDLKLSAEKPPKWMFDKSLPELQRLAERFTAIAQSGGHAKGYDRESTYERGLMYASAARTKQEEEERKSRQKYKKTRTKQSDEIAKAIKEEISLVKELQSAYDTLTKKGDSHANAIAKVQDLYGKTINLLNKDMDKFGLPKLDLSIIKGNNHNEVLAFFEKLRNVLESKGLSNLERMEAVEGVVKEFRLKAETYNLDIITKGLNNELGKLKDEYELAVSLDASPELGDIFADMMGLSKEELASLPRDFQGVMDKLQTILDSKVDGFDLSKNLNKSDLEEWITANGLDLQSELAKQLTAYVDYANKVRKDEGVKQIAEWDKLLEKYAEYEYKRKQILDTYERDMATAIKRGAGQEIIDAITNKRDKDMAQLDFERFQQMPEWVMATGEISTMTEEAIGGLIKKLEEYKKTAKNLDAKQIKQINNALKNLYKEQRRNNPFKAIANVMDLARERFEDYQVEIEKVEKELEKYNDIDQFKMTNDEKKSFEELQNRWKELKQLQEEASHVDTSEWISAIKSTSDVITDAIGLFDELAKAIGGMEKSDLDRIFGVISKAFQGAQTGSSFGTYGAIIGAVVGAAAGIVTEYKDVWNGQVRINKQLKESAERVEILATAYNKLQRKLNEAYGDESLGTKKLMAINKEMELAELERQLELEKSRVAKERDLAKISELEDKVNELKYDVENATREMIMDILDISDAQDWADSLVKNMIEAFRQGEDYMKAYDQSFEDMINSMITKAIMGKVIGEKIEELFKKIEQRSIKRGDPENNPEVQAAKAYMDDIQREYNALIALSNDNVDVPSHVIDNAKRMLEEAQEAYEQAYKKAVKITPEDVASVKQDVEDWRSGVKSEFEAYMDAFGVAFGSSKEAQSLSALQQGIQGVTETTAGAIEAYLNGVSQQVYLQSDTLMQIRDMLVTFDLDVQVATMSQMLLQLQQSYQVQLAIQNILNGWSNPSGMAVRVEMV